jgi:predicted enzyme related to lactoylglutathione lyase
VHLPSHPVWFWLILGAPFLTWLALWIAARNPRVRLKPLLPWLTAGYLLFGLLYLLFDIVPMGNNKVLHLVLGAGLWTCLPLGSWIRRREMFETLRSPNARWYSMWPSAEFSVPAPSLRIRVRDIASVSPWYVEKLGLRKLAEAPPEEPGAATFKFKTDGHSVILTDRSGFQTGKTPILFTKNICRIKNVLVARGVEAGPIEQDRQGIHYFQVRDPEGNVIEVVEER